MDDSNLSQESVKVRTVQEIIVDFYLSRGRRFPWRETEDPYTILISEILLQKTTAKQVLDVYEEFFKEFPTIASLAKSRIEEIERFVRPLGLVKRAKFMKELARTIVDDLNSEIPKDVDNLLQLKGVGPYTANAVVCFVFGKSLPVVDSNIAKVLKRYFGVESNKPAYADKDLWALARKVVPDGKCREYYYGLIDLAAELCHAKKPECLLCPLKNRCRFARRLQTETRCKSFSVKI